jgi:hypothetical protein
MAKITVFPFLDPDLSIPYPGIKGNRIRIRKELKYFLFLTPKIVVKISEI